MAAWDRGGRPISAEDVYADSSYLSIRSDPHNRCVIAEFKGFATSAEFRAGTMRILDAIRDRHADSLISDNRKLEVVVDADQLWIRDTWVAQAVGAGLKRIAVVLAKRGLGRFASEEIISQFPSATFTTRTFDSTEDARKWVAGAGKRE
jgi:hypothetical protein